MTNLNLTLATHEECQQYEQAGTQSGLPANLRYLEKHPVAIRERFLDSSRTRYDHMHLSVPDNNPNLVQWWGRSSTGYHYPVGPVMRIIAEQGE